MTTKYLECFKICKKEFHKQASHSELFKKIRSWKLYLLYVQNVQWLKFNHIKKYFRFMASS